MRLIGHHRVGMRRAGDATVDLFVPGLHAARRRLGAACAGVCPNASRATRSTSRRSTFEGRLAEIAAAGEGAVLVRLLAGRPPGAACGAARPRAYAGLVHGGRLGRDRGRRRARGAPRRGRRASWPPGSRRSRSRRSWPRWERQPVFADQSRRAGRGPAPRPPEPRPASAGAAAAQRRPGRCSSRSGTSLETLSSCPVLAWPASSTTVRYAASAGRRPDGRAALVGTRPRGASAAPGAGHAPQLAAAPDAVRRALLLEFLDEHLGERVARPRRRPGPGPAGTASRPSRGRRQRARDARRRTARASPARRPARARSAAASCSAAAMPHGPSSVLERNGSSPCSRAPRAAPRAPARSRRCAASLTFDRRRRPRARPRARTSSDVGHRLVGGDRHATRARAPRPAPRASRTAARRARGRSRLERARSRATASSTVQAPFASSRSAGHGADRVAHGGHALLVVGQPDLHLEAGVAVAQALARRAPPPPPGGPAGSVQVHGDRVGCAARRAGAPRGAPRGRAAPSPRRRAPAAARGRAPPLRSAATARSSGTPS